ncbi:MAG: Uma2 family endonuclease [Blastocatellales bacterium]
MSALPKTRYTIEEYIELLKNSDERFEYFDGEVVSMAGGKIAHGDIASNIVRHLGNRLVDRPCRVSGGDVALKVPLAWPFRFPDVSVTCGERLIEGFQGIEMIINPLLIVEVLSPSTEIYDREGKFLAYQSIESFQEYLLVAQDRPHVTQYVRQPSGKWLRADIIGLDSEVSLESLGVTLPLAEIYWQINFPAPDELNSKPDQQPISPRQ